MKKSIISIIVTLIVGFLYFYIAVPALNFNNMEFYSFIMFLILVYWFTSSILNFGFNRFDFKKTIKRFSIVFIIPAMFVLIFVVNIICSPVFNSKKYANRIEIDQTKSFAEDVELVDFSKLPLLDKTSSQKLGDRVMGQMSDLVSQYNVSNLYTQINFNNKIVRVTPLEYASFIKWVTNRKDYSEMTDFILGSADECLKLNPNIKCAKPDYCYVNYLDGEHKEKDINIRYAQAVEESGVESDSIKFMKLGPVKCVSIYHKGPFGSIGQSYGKVMKYIEENGYEILEYPRECYIHGVWDCESELDWLTEIQVPIKKM